MNTELLDRGSDPVPGNGWVLFRVKPFGEIPGGHIGVIVGVADGDVGDDVGDDVGEEFWSVHPTTLKAKHSQVQRALVRRVLR